MTTLAPARRRLSDRLFPGDRRAWLTAAAVIAIGLMVIAVELVIPRDFYTGTNSVRTRGFSTELARGDKLCVPGLNIPADTGRVQVEVGTDGGPLPRQTATLDVGGRTLGPATVRGTGSTPAKSQKIEFAFAERPGSPDSAPGTLCVRSAGKVFYGGMAMLQGNDATPTINGQPSLNRVAIWYLPKSGQKRSLLSQAPAIVQRAALFRPGIVGPWTYVVLLLIGLPLLGYAAIWLMATAAERGPRRLALMVALLAFCNAAAWALITPSFEAPDETEHFAYAQYFSETGKRVSTGPDPSRGVYSTEEVLAIEALHLFSSTEQSDGRPPWLKLEEKQMAQRRATLGYVPRQDNGGGNAPATQSHSPLYYSVLTPGYVVTQGGSTWSQLFAMRLLSALFGALVAVCAFGIVRELLPREPWAAVAAGLLVGFEPMFGFISGAVNNDNGVNGLAALAIYLTVRGLRRGLTLRTGAALGAVLVVLPLMKGTGYELYPPIGLAVLVMLWRRHGRAALPGFAALAGAFVAATVLWKVGQPIFEGKAPPGAGPSSATGSATAIGLARDNIPGYLSYLWQVFLPKLPFMSDLWTASWPFYDIYVQRGFASFGWYAVLFPKWVYGVILLAMAGVGISGLGTLARYRDFARRHWAEIAFLVLVPIAVIAAVEAAYFSSFRRPLTAEFGRYGFPAISAVSALAVGSLFVFGRRRVAQVGVGLVAAMIVLSYASQLLTLAGFYT